MEHKPTLKLNRNTGKYELTIGVDAESMKRRLFAYALQEHIDPFNLDEWQKAIGHIARLEEWQGHPQAEIVLNVQPTPDVKTQPMPPPSEHKQEVSTGYLSREELRAKALALPVDQWETLLTPYGDAAGQERDRIGQRRHRERKTLEELQRETAPEPMDMQKLHAIAHAVNSNGIH